MTANDVILGPLWAVIDRPYKGTAGTNLSVTDHELMLRASVDVSRFRAHASRAFALRVKAEVSLLAQVAR